MSFSEDWRDRHGQKKSNGKIMIYLVLLAVIFLMIARSGNFSSQFLKLFSNGSDSTLTESVELETNE